MLDKTWPILYHKGKTGRIEMWQVVVRQSAETDPAEMYITHGKVGGKLITNIRVIPKGKNIGKSNETTAFEQACLEADSKYVNNIKLGSFTSIEETEKHIVILPMLAAQYTKTPKSFPLIAQPKFDGIRALNHPMTINPIGDILPYPAFGDYSLVTRGAEALPYLEHIKNELRAIHSMVNKENFFTDGELFTFRFPFEELAGYIGKVHVTEDELKNILTGIDYHIFDCCMLSRDHWSQLNRLNFLSEIFESHKFQYLKLCPWDVVNNEEEIKACHDRFVEEGYEGIIPSIDFSNASARRLKYSSAFFDK